MKNAILIFVLFFCAPSFSAHRATKVRIPSEGGALYATIDGTEKKIALHAYKAWLMDDGLSVVYSTRGGAGGFENEGQALFRFQTSDGRVRRILSEYFEVTNVESELSTSGKVAYLVSMEDGGLGASHVAVTDPMRGEVFREDGAQFAKSTGPGSLTLAWYKDEDWDKVRRRVYVAPYKTKTYDIDEILHRNVIINKR